MLWNLIFLLISLFYILTLFILPNQRIYFSLIFIISTILIISFRYRFYSKHLFWDTQPVARNTFSEREGIILKPKFITYSCTLSPDFTWTTIDDINEFRNFLMENYRKNEIYSSTYLEWILNSPYQHISKLSKFKRNQWNIVLKKDNKIMGTIIGRPVLLNIKNKLVEGFYVDFLCIDKNLRGQRLAPNLISKIIETWKDAKLDLNIFKIDSSPLPFNEIGKFYYYILDLSNYQIKNPQKLISLDEKDIDEAYHFFLKHLTQYKFYQVFTSEEFKYYFLPKTYIYKNNENQITGFANLIEMDYQINGLTVSAIELLYCFYENDEFMDAIMDLIKEHKYHYLITLDLMNNSQFIKKYQMTRNHLTYYYFYNYLCKINKNEIGFLVS